MKKILIFSTFILVASIGVAKELQAIGTDQDCQPCESCREKCCMTKNGTVFYGKISN